MRRAARGACLVLLCLLIASCGASPSPTAHSTVTATATATATRAPTSTATPVPTADPGQPCRPQPGDTYTYHQVGDLVVRQADFGLAYPSSMLPDGTPLNPYLLPTGAYQHGIAGSPPTDPNLKEPGGGYIFTVCNSSATRSHALTSVSLKIASFTPYTGQLNTWSFCDGYFVRPTGAQYGGCGGGFAGDAYLHVSFPASAGAGASVAAQTSTSAPTGTALPITLKPGVSILVNVGITAPTSPGQYAFAFAVSVDGAAPVYFSTATPTLLAPIAHKWTGQACLTAIMQQQIPPATSPSSYYICPQS